MHYIADLFSAGLRRIQADDPDWFVGIRQNGVVIGLEFDHPEGAKFVMRELYENGVWAIFSTLDPRVLQFKPGLLLEPRPRARTCSTASTSRSVAPGTPLPAPSPRSSLRRWRSVTTKRWPSARRRNTTSRRHSTLQLLNLSENANPVNLGQLRATIGLLTTLDAPSFRDEFLPDKYMLRALVYRDLCQYLPAKRAAKELTRRFSDSLEAIRERDDLHPGLPAAAARRTAMARPRVPRGSWSSLNLEGEQLGRHAGGFGDRLYKHLQKVYDLAHAEAERLYQQRLEDAVREEADKLLRADEQVRLMEYEVGLKLYERVKRGGQAASSPRRRTRSPPAQIAFKFTGEYWNDELRSYRVSIPSRCIEEGGQ